MKDDNKILKIVYTFFLGFLLAMFIGLGINTFYEGPKEPEYPIGIDAYTSKQLTDEQAKKQHDYEVAMAKYNKEMQPYNRNVSIIALIASVILLVVSLMYEKKIKIISDGVLLGGLFTLLYSLIRGFASQDTKYVFIVVTIGLIVALYLGYHRFVKPTTATTTKKSKK
ncbi:MAG: hypothetical protein AAB395_03225 [Patescibacteria group bacterium]|mgnify:CR=1 FL=1